MKTFSEYVESLQKHLEDNPEDGGYTVVYASDDEGNSYHAVTFSPSTLIVEMPLTHHMEVVSPEDCEEELDEENYFKVICIN